MKPTIGWVLLSKDAVSQAETQLRDDVTGVRDEVGFLLIHSGYANRFFPGTSVLHTRLRYVMFIPWMYQELLRGGDYGNIEQRVTKFETRLAGRLRNLEGTIGKRSYPEPTSQPPTFVYWTALGTWGFLRQRPDGIWPTKTQLHRSVERHNVPHRLFDDDGYFLDDIHEFFIRTPKAPKGWRNHDGILSFEMPKNERDFVRRQLVGVSRFGYDSRPSLLSSLAKNVEEINIDNNPRPWSKNILRIANVEDREALLRSQRAAALSAIGRAVYAAMVETIREKDGLPTDRRHRNHLPVVLRDFTKMARKLELDALHADIQGLPRHLHDVLDATLNWLKKPKNPLALRDVYGEAEKLRKGGRARLPGSLSAKERRAEWRPEEQTLAEPIHYRWPNIIRLLKDLKGAA